MKFKRLSALILTMSLVIINSGCEKKEQPEAEKFSGTAIKKQASPDIEEVHLRDKKLLYEN